MAGRGRASRQGFRLILVTAGNEDEEGECGKCSKLLQYNDIFIYLWFKLNEKKYSYIPARSCFSFKKNPRRKRAKQP